MKPAEPQLPTRQSNAPSANMASKVKTPAELFPFNPTEPLDTQIKSGLYLVFRQYAWGGEWSAEQAKDKIVEALDQIANFEVTYQIYPDRQPPVLPPGFKFISSLDDRIVSMQVDKSGPHLTFHELPDVEAEDYKQDNREFYNKTVKAEITSMCEDFKSSKTDNEIVYAVWKGLFELFTAAEVMHGQFQDIWDAKSDYFGKLRDMWDEISVDTLRGEDRGAYNKWMDESWFDEEQKEKDIGTQSDSEGFQGFSPGL